MEKTFKIQRIGRRNKASRCAWPHWFRKRDLIKLRSEIDEAIATKRADKDGSWPYAYELAQQK